jgi:hypothetical protein
MSTNNTAARPSTLEDIKRSAKSLKKQLCIKHYDALNIAAISAGFHNFKHAQNSLPSISRCKRPEAAKPKYPVTFSASWEHYATKERGREQLTIDLSQPWNEIIQEKKLGHYRNRHLCELFSGIDRQTLALRTRFSCQSSARTGICGAARTFAFMEATGLKPMTSFRRAYPSDAAIKKINPNWVSGDDPRFPGQDHASYWMDPITRKCLIANEPYTQSANKSTSCKTWCDTFGYRMEMPHWAGMYNPYGETRLYLLTHATKGIPLDPIVDALNQLPPPVSDINWTGVSLTGISAIGPHSALVSN